VKLAELRIGEWHVRAHGYPGRVGRKCYSVRVLSARRTRVRCETKSGKVVVVPLGQIVAHGEAPESGVWVSS